MSIVHRSPTTDSVRATEQFMSLTESQRIGVCRSPPPKIRPPRSSPTTRVDRKYRCTLKLRLLLGRAPGRRPGLLYPKSQRASPTSCLLVHRLVRIISCKVKLSESKRFPGDRDGQTNRVLL